MPTKLVLIVDDCDDARLLQGEFLRYSGYEIVEARDGAEAIEMARRLSPAVVLLDLAMPNVDRFETARRLKGDPLTRSIPIIAVTAYGLQEWAERARRAGCDAVFQKPVHPIKILEVVRDAMGSRAVLD